MYKINENIKKYNHLETLIKSSIDKYFNIKKKDIENSKNTHIYNEIKNLIRTLSNNVSKTINKNIKIINEKKQYNILRKNPLKLKFISYSEYYEDLILYGLFYDISNGFYIDIGANSPDKGSVTKIFYELGWSGINIEPLDIMYNELILKRPRDLNLAVCIGDKKGITNLYIYGGLTTTDERYKKANHKINRKMSVLPMSTITKLYVPKNKEIEFCKIDVEGKEKQVLLGYDFVNYRPKVFCIESTKPCTLIPSFNEWENILIKNNYSFAYEYKVNRFYIDNNVKDINKRFIGIEKLKMKFMK